ncbi:MAG TPA: DUF4365 domain-containing protein [Micromonosporaceae bacterium]|nr:DUF4365 domain-containing protein [Micromonosporaceae bacterium]
MTYERYNHQGYFGESFVRVLVSAAGLIAGKQDADHTGVDFSIDFPGVRGTARFPKIEAQVKSWSKPAGSAHAWHYPMKTEHYNNIAGADFSVPRFLFLVVVPSDERAYAEADETYLRLSHCGYWASLADKPLIDPNVQGSITVYVPKGNKLTVPSLRKLLDPIPAQRVSAS